MRVLHLVKLCFEVASDPHCNPAPGERGYGRSGHFVKTGRRKIQADRPAWNLWEIRRYVVWITDPLPSGVVYPLV